MLCVFGERKIKTKNRQAYGYRGMKFFEFKILAMHDPIYSSDES